MTTLSAEKRGEGVSAYEACIVLLIAICVNLAAQMVFSVFGMVINRVSGLSVTNVYLQLSGMTLIQLCFIAVPLIYFGAIKKRRPKMLAGLSAPKPVCYPLAVVTPIITVICFYLPAAWFDTLLRQMNYNGGGGVVLTTAGHWIFGIIVMCVLAPIGEELIFRGVLLSGLRGKVPALGAAALSGLAFSLMHMNPEQTVYQFLLGFACAWAAINGRSLYVPIIIHAVSNLIALLLQLESVGGLFSTLMGYLTYNPALSVISTLVLLVGGAAAVYFIWRAVRAKNVVTATVMPRASKPSLGDNNVSDAEARQADYLQKKSDEQNAEKQKDKIAKFIFGAALGVCLILWLLIFANAMLTGNGIL